MALNILTSDVKQQLEQERSRLMSQRQAVIDEAVKQATLEIDQMLDHLNGLLGGEVVPSSGKAVKNGKATEKSAPEEKPAPTNGRKTKAKIAPQKGKRGVTGRKAAAATTETPEAPAAEAAVESPAVKSGPRSPFSRGKKGTAAGKTTEKRPRVARTPGKTQIPGKKFDLEALKREYKKMPLIEAIEQAMGKAPEQIYGIDDLISALFTKVDPEDISLARRDLGLVVARAVKAGTLEKVQDKPSRYKLKTGQ